MKFRVAVPRADVREKRRVLLFPPLLRATTSRPLLPLLSPSPSLREVKLRGFLSKASCQPAVSRARALNLIV